MKRHREDLSIITCKEILQEIASGFVGSHNTCTRVVAVGLTHLFQQGGTLVYCGMFNLHRTRIRVTVHR